MQPTSEYKIDKRTSRSNDILQKMTVIPYLLLEPNGSLLFSQESVMGPYTKPFESSSSSTVMHISFLCL